MANWHYYNENREKIGPFESGVLKQLTQQGIITPETFIEDPTGRTGLAKDVKGLTFPDPEPSAESQMFAFRCPNCQCRLQAKKKSTGKTKECPTCKASFTVPAIDTLPQLSEPNPFTTPVPLPPTAQTVPMPPVTPLPPGVPLDAKQRKARIHFWTILCIVTFVLCTLVSTLLAYGMRELEAGVQKEIQQKKSQVFESGVGGPNTIHRLDRIEQEKQMAEEQMALIGFRILGLLALISIPYLCCYYLYIHRLWEEIPVEFARTTPGNAAGFALIPLFHLYWLYVAFVGMYADMNKATESYGLGARFKQKTIRNICHVWVFLFVIGMYCELVMDVTPMRIIVVETIFTLWAYWRIRKDVLEFIDIKSSVGK